MIGEEQRKRVVTAIFAAATATLVHAPALRMIGRAIPGEPASDALRATWSVWLMARQLPGWPFSTALVNFPAGVDLLPFPALTLMAAAPLTALFGPLTATTLIVFGHAIFAFLAAGALVRVLGGGRGGELLAGALVVSQPLIGGAIRDGTLEVLAVGWVPLTLWAMVQACRGSLRHGALAALFFLCTCLESVYYGSFTALAVLSTLVTLRSRRGLLAVGLAGLCVAVGVGVLGLTLRPVLEGVRAALASADQSIATLQAANAARWDALVSMAKAPGNRGWHVGDLYAPPLAHWVVFGVGALAGLRRAPWLTALGAVFLLIGLNHDWARVWLESPLGEVVRFPRRAMEPMALALACGAGVGLRELLRWPKVELAVGAVAALPLAWIGANAAGLGPNYPLVTLPEPAFAAALREDDEDCAALFLPLEVPGEKSTVRTEQPVFAGLGTEIASADLLILQMEADKAGWYTPSLATAARREGATGLLPRTFTNLARPKFGAQLAQSALLPPEAYEPELRWLTGEGLKYVVVDLSAYRDTELEHVDEVLRAVAVEVTDFPDGGGVRVYRLYDARPERVEAPKMSGAGEVFAGFMGVVTNTRGLVGRLRVEARSGTALIECPVHPGDNAFECKVGKTVDEVFVYLDDAPLPFHREGSLLDAKLVVDVPDSERQGLPTESAPLPDRSPPPSNPPPTGEPQPTGLPQPTGQPGPPDQPAPPNPDQPAQGGTTGSQPPKFTGTVDHRQGLVGPVAVEAVVGTRAVRCPIRPETGAFDCGWLGTVETVRLIVNDRSVPSAWDGAQSDAHVWPTTIQ